MKNLFKKSNLYYLWQNQSNKKSLEVNKIGSQKITSYAMKLIQKKMYSLVTRAFKSLVFFSVILLVACSAKPPQMTTTLRSVSFLNPNIYNQASPVVVTVYQLKAPNVFQQANFFALNNNDYKVLGADLLDKREIEIRPQQKQVLHIALSSSTNYIGVIAAFRDNDVAQWRQLAAVKSGEKIKLNIMLSTQRVEMSVKQ
jgi:type VI secretion system protein VasD